MTRAHFRDNVLDQNGNIVSAASVRVEDPDTSDLITETMYAAASGVTTVANPLTSDTNGMVEFYLTDPKRVQFTTSKSGYSNQVSIVDVVNADDLPHAYAVATNQFLGSGAGNSTATGARNMGFGLSVLATVTSGYDNVGFGWHSLDALTEGQGNVAFGRETLGAVVTANNNTAVGNVALILTTGSNNTGVGSQVLYKNTTGFENTAVGLAAMYENTTGASNSAFGDEALRHNTSGIQNVAFGMYALYENTTGSYNVAVGFDALNWNTHTSTGSYNTALGYEAGSADLTGTNNLYLGYKAGYHGSSTDGLTNATAIGYNTQVTQSNSLILGTGANVGIGTTAPASTLHVATGSIQSGVSASALTYATREAVLTFSRSNLPTTYLTKVMYSINAAPANTTLSFDICSGETTQVTAMTMTGQGYVGVGATVPDRLLHTEVADATTNAVSYALRLGHVVSTAATGMANGGGVGIEFELETATDGTNQLAATDTTVWVDATNASRKARRLLYVYDTAAREAIRLEASGSAPMLGFFGVDAVARPTALTTQLTAITHTAPGTPDYAIQDLTQTTPWGFASHDEGNSVLAVIANLQTRLAEAETKLQNLGLLT